jgi:hypothetical protein
MTGDDEERELLAEERGRPPDGNNRKHMTEEYEPGLETG